MAGSHVSRALADRQADPAGRLATDRATHRWVPETLGRGEVLRPEDRPGGRHG